MGVMLTLGAAERNIPSGYYNGLDGKTKEALKAAALAAIDNQKVISYGDATWNVFKDSDVRANGTWWDIYSNIQRNASSGHGGMNIEHGVPNSWWGHTKNEAYKDIHHLFPSDTDANSRKSNYPLGEVATETWSNGVTTIGKPSNGHGGQGGYVYEPADEYKGDNARAYFYMATRYPNITWKTNSDWGIMFVQQSYPTLNSWSLELLLRWSSEDPVSQKEIDRNEAIYKHQKNRNPFVDFPDLAEYIWGDKMGQPFDLKAHLGGSGDDPEPPQPGETPVLIEPAANEVLDFGQVIKGQEGNVTLILRGKYLTTTPPLKLAVYDNSQTDDAALFSIDGGATETVSVDAVNSESGLSVRIDYNPVRVGEHESHLRISGGGLKGNVLLTLRGTCVEAPVLTAPRALPATDVTATSYVANWEAVEGEEVDYYVVNRTKYINGQAETEQLQAHNDLSLEINDFCGNESYTVQSVRSGIMSPESNSIVVGETSITEVEAGIKFGVTTGPGSITISCSETIDRLTIADISGRVIGVIDGISNGETIALPRGLYLLRASGVARPVKVIVRGE